MKGTQHALANAIAWAYFMDHKATGDDEVLADIAAQHGYSRAEALQAMRDPEALAETHDLATAAANRASRAFPSCLRQQFALPAQPQEVRAGAHRHRRRADAGMKGRPDLVVRQAHHEVS